MRRPPIDAVCEREQARQCCPCSTGSNLCTTRKAHPSLQAATGPIRVGQRSRLSGAWCLACCARSHPHSCAFGACAAQSAMLRGGGGESSGAGVVVGGVEKVPEVSEPALDPDDSFSVRGRTLSLHLVQTRFRITVPSVLFSAPSAALGRASHLVLPLPVARCSLSVKRADEANGTPRRVRLCRYTGW